eukprot:751422-Hanusia_phi.AAC.8
MANTLLRGACWNVLVIIKSNVICEHQISPCHQFLAYTADMNGNERYMGEVQVVAAKLERLISTSSCLIFPDDSPDSSKREKILEERNGAFYMDVGMTKDKSFITISSNSKTSSEVWTPSLEQAKCERST